MGFYLFGQIYQESNKVLIKNLSNLSPNGKSNYKDYQF